MGVSMSPTSLLPFITACLVVLVLGPSLPYCGVTCQELPASPTVTPITACSADYELRYKHVIYVDPSAPPTSNCDSQQQAGPTKCPDLNKALQFHQDSTAYVLASGTHYLKQDTSNLATSFDRLSDIGFFGQREDEPARVECEGDAGLAFSNFVGVTMRDVVFSSCGALRSTTTKDFAKTNFFLLQVKVGLYFYNGSEVSMCRVSVGDGVNALGVLMYDTDGTVDIYHSNFSNNVYSSEAGEMSANSSSSRVGGGGFNVEFSYCVPGDQACDSDNSTPSSIQTTHNANSSYTFYNCSFRYNSAWVMLATRTSRLIARKEIHQGFGKGGGLGLYFTSNASRNFIRISHCLFERNRALWGAGVGVSFGDTSVGNRIVIERSTFQENACHPHVGMAGGAIRILSTLDHHFTSPQDESVEGNSMEVIDSYFTKNRALNGGAISFSPAFQALLQQNQTTHLAITGSVFCGNSARLGAAVHLEFNPLFISGTLNNVTVKNCRFENNSINYSEGTSNYDMGIGVFYTFQVPLDFRGSVDFSSNYGSALVLVNTHGIFDDTRVNFKGNRGNTGGAIAFIGGSNIVVNDNTNMSFVRNMARRGGAIYNYITSELDMKWNTACFVRYSDPFLPREKWKASFTFINNTSTLTKKNSIHSTSVFPCALRNMADEEDLSQILLFCVNKHWRFVGSNCTDEIQTQGNSYQFRNASEISTVPGKGFTLPVEVRDDMSHNITDQVSYTSTVSSSPFSSSSSPGDDGDSRVARVDPRFTITSNNFLVLTGEENTSVSLDLQSLGSRSHYLQIQVQLLNCPPGFHFEYSSEDEGEGEGEGEGISPTDNGTNSSYGYLGQCKCRYKDNFRNKLNCSLQDFQAHIPWNYWIGWDPTDQGDNLDRLVMSEMPDQYSEQYYNGMHYIVLPTTYEELDEQICGVRNRTGPICGRCKENYSTSVNSYNYVCTRCDDTTNFAKNIALFMVFAYLPYILLLAAVVYFDLKLTSSATNGFILFAQLVSLDLFDVNGSSTHVDFETVGMHNAYLFVYGIFNLNSFANLMKPFCIARDFTTLDVLCLEYTLAGLPLLLAAVMYLLLRLKSIRCICCMSRRSGAGGLASLSLPHLPRRKEGDGGREGRGGVGGRKRKKRKRRESSLIHALVAFILLTYTKLSLVSMKILTTQKLFDEEGKYLSDSRIYLAGHLSFSSREFLLPYGLIAMLMMFFFVLLPPLFLLGLPQLVDRLLDIEKFSCLRRFWPTVTIHIFLDAFQGFYKPNRRFFAGIYFLFRLAILITNATISNYLDIYALQQLLIMLMIVLLGAFKPYKREVFNMVDMLIFCNLALANLISTYVYGSSLSATEPDKGVMRGVYLVQYCLLWAPLVYMLSYLVFKLMVRLHLCQCITKRLDSYRHRSSVSQQVFFNPSKEEEENRSDTLRSDESMINLSDDNDDDIDSLSDAVLFSRARATNKFRPPSQMRSRSQKHSGNLVSVVSTASGDSEERSTVDYSDTTNTTNTTTGSKKDDAY